MSKPASKAEVRAQAEEFAAFAALWDDAHEMNAAHDDAADKFFELWNEALEMNAMRDTNAELEAAEDLPPVLRDTNAETPRYKLNGPAAELARQGRNAAATLQKKGDPKLANPNWRADNHKATNTRAIALAVIMYDLGAEPFTAGEAQAVLKKYKDGGKLHLGSGTPASYVKAFVKNGYFMPAMVAEPVEAEQADAE